jgi:hypothetical protein
MADKPQIDLAHVTDILVSSDRDGATTIALGDGIRIRVLENGTIRIRSTNHQMVYTWLTNKPEAGQQSVAGIQLTRKD